MSPAPVVGVGDVTVWADSLVVRWMMFQPATPMCRPAVPRQAACRLGGTLR